MLICRLVWPISKIYLKKTKKKLKTTGAKQILWYVWYEGWELTPKAVLTLCVLVCVPMHGCDQESYIFSITQLPLISTICPSPREKGQWLQMETTDSQLLTGKVEELLLHLAQWQWQIYWQNTNGWQYVRQCSCACVFLAKTWPVVLVCGWSVFVPWLLFKWDVCMMIRINTALQNNCSFNTKSYPSLTAFHLSTIYRLICK